ncbi:MAG: sialidase family protein [Candidatus Latescibacteria bacterium]|jgi:hypothetical protein|nr:sialidase family protein [Candidatus Latescibacterota bacterium]
MDIIETGILARGEPGTQRAALTFPTVTALSDGSLLATYRAGSTKDAEDEAVEFRRSTDSGVTWEKPYRPFPETHLHGLRGSLKLCYVTEVCPGRLIGACMWVDRETYPGKPLFDAGTEGCLPMVILMSESDDGGQSWSPLREVPMPDDIGPPSLTNPLIALPDGTLVMSIETNKQYEDASKWHQRVVTFRSADDGQTWDYAISSGEDPTGRIFNWDQRAAVSPDGRIATFTWTYDSEEARYLNIHRRISSDGGCSWSPAEDLGIADQAGHPAVLPDGRTVLPWVDRFGSASIRARAARSIDARFDHNSEVILYAHREASTDSPTDDMGELLSDMSLWTFGLPYAEALPDGDVLVLHYAGSEQSMDIHWSRLNVD